MEYINKDLGSFNLHMIKTKKFKTISVRVVFHTPIIKEEITMRNLVTDILIQSSKEYPTRRDLTMKAEDLYAAEISTNTQRLGNYIITSFLLDVLNDRYTEEGNLEEAFKFLKNIIFNPNTDNNKSFSKDSFEVISHNAKVALDSIKEDSSGYSTMRMLEAYNQESPIAYRMIGYQEDLEQITPESLYDYYKNMIDKDYVDIFIVGDFNSKEMLELVKKYFKFKKIKKKKASYQLKCAKIRKRKKIARETIPNNQSKLALACPSHGLTEYERTYPIALGNLILGGGTDSKLFQDVREKNSLCYTISSYFRKLDDILIIRAGIDSNNYKKTVDLITKNLSDMKKGKFSEEDLDKAKEYYITSAEEMEETPSRIITECLYETVLGIEPLKTRIDKIKKVTKPQIVKAMKKINIDTIFLLEGVNNENN